MVNKRIVWPVMALGKGGPGARNTRGATLNNIKLTYSMQFSICQLLVLDHDYSYWLDINYNYFTTLFNELAVDSITFWSF